MYSKFLLSLKFILIIVLGFSLWNLGNVGSEFVNGKDISNLSKIDLKEIENSIKEVNAKDRKSSPVINNQLSNKTNKEWKESIKNNIFGLTEDRGDQEVNNSNEALQNNSKQSNESSNEIPENYFKLLAVLDKKAKNKAIIIDKHTNKSYLITQNDSLKGFKVKLIDKDKVILIKDKHKFTLTF